MIEFFLSSLNQFDSFCFDVFVHQLWGQNTRVPSSCDLWGLCLHVRSGQALYTPTFYMSLKGPVYQVTGLKRWDCGIGALSLILRYVLVTGSEWGIVSLANQIKRGNVTIVINAQGKLFDRNPKILFCSAVVRPDFANQTAMKLLQNSLWSTMLKSGISIGFIALAFMRTPKALMTLDQLTW